MAKSSFYVDDFLASISTKAELFTLHSEIKSLLQSGGFYLTKFHTNCRELQDKILPEDRAPSTILINFDHVGDVSHKALGMHWNSQKDFIAFSIQLEVGDATRRGILATFSQIFDPFGIVQPLLIVPKLLIRDLCKLKLSWDESIPIDQERVWIKWLKGVDVINSLTVD